jgi:hypothetical protein
MPGGCSGLGESALACESEQAWAFEKIYVESGLNFDAACVPIRE